MDDFDRGGGDVATPGHVAKVSMHARGRCTFLSFQASIAKEAWG